MRLIVLLDCHKSGFVFSDVKERSLRMAQALVDLGEEGRSGCLNST